MPESPPLEATGEEVPMGMASVDAKSKPEVVPDGSGQRKGSDDPPSKAQQDAAKEIHEYEQKSK
ncbi:hypothetical protein PLICRDRAFT_54706 [Plicaturopsis crispa FD-325 SS-3]|nr:hypothetical protein PLICRDRAFT_54706 [Plicaturopsis crispa FD-325 SS-3]